MDAERCTLTSLRSAGTQLESAVGILHQGTVDLPRLAGIVQSRRVRAPSRLHPRFTLLTPRFRRQMFDLVTEPEVFAAQRALANEMAPQIDELIRRAEDGLEGLKQKERTLRAKVGTITFSSSCLCTIGTLTRLPPCHLLTSLHQVEKRQAASSRSQTPITVDQSELDTLEQKLASLQQKKNRLGREVEALDERAAKAATARARPGAATAGRGLRA